MSYLPLLVGAYLVLASQPALRTNLSEWQSYKLEHGKQYETPEIDSMRRVIFAHNKLRVEQFHKSGREETKYFSLRLNHLADQSELEMMSMNGFRLPADIKSRREQLLQNSPDAERFLASILEDDSIEVPVELDWRQTPGRVSSVKNQGQCGSCWAFASAGVLEGQERTRAAANLTTGTNEDQQATLVDLSPQNLVDCVKSDYGCSGGIMSDALAFVKSEGGIDSEAAYPYEGVERKCRFQKDKSVITDSGFAVLPAGDEQKLQQVVAKFGPVAVAIDASSFWFQVYHKGVYYNRRCKSKEDQLDHAVLVVGYGTDPKKGDYWLVKNSWGPKWGEHGYIRMARNRNNNCGIATIATIPTFS